MAAGVPLVGVVCGDPTVPKRSGSGGFLSKQQVPRFYRIVEIVDSRQFYHIEAESMITDAVFFRQRSLIIALIAFALAFIAWNLPQLDFVLYPLRLFVTFVHEAGHGLSALVTGGSIGRLEVYSNGSGIATTMGGSRALILPAGYLGAALFGGVLFYLANTFFFSRTLSFVLGVMVAVIAVAFTDFLSTAWLVGVGFALILGLIAWKAGRNFNMLVLNFLAVITGLNAVMDLVGVVNYSNARVGDVVNDAAAFSREVAPFLPPVIWAVVWALLAVLILGLSVYYSLIKRHMRL
jgi:hypothetical protein